eukprot:5897712-Prymnesium_polylepis.2
MGHGGNERDQVPGIAPCPFGSCRTDHKFSHKPAQQRTTYITVHPDRRGQCTSAVPQERRSPGQLTRSNRRPRGNAASHREVAYNP